MNDSLSALNERHREIGNRIDANKNSLAAAITSLHYSLRPELESIFGPKGRERCLEDARHHLSYIAEAIRLSSPALFADYINWAKSMLSARGIPSTDLKLNLDCMRESLSETFGFEFKEIVNEYIETALEQLSPAKTEVPDSIEEPLSDLSREYLEHLLNGERHLASRLVLDSVETGVSVKDIYLHVFQWSQREIGRLWQANRITVAQEHYCTASTQLIMSLLYPRIFRTERSGRTLVATSVSGDLHEIGIRMVADFFEMEGWDTYYLGANMPVKDVLKACEDRQAHIMGVSVTMSYHLRSAEELISAVRRSDKLSDLKIMVGGYPFHIDPQLCHRIGADLHASDACGAVEVANKLLKP
jgi:MerR family transcriptional regulator, light-induced transcriptional regulator